MSSEKKASNTIEMQLEEAASGPNVTRGLIRPFTDLGNGERFADRYQGQFMHTQATGWLVYKRGRWQEDKTGEVQRAAHETVRSIRDETELVADGEDGDKMRSLIVGWAIKSESSGKMKSLLEIAEGLGAFARSYVDFDQHPELLNCGNGTYNFVTGEFGPHDPEHLLTKGTDIRFDPAADCPRWEKFLLDIMNGKTHLRAYLARAGGYTISAETGGQCLFIPWGMGGTGKSTFLDVMRGVMGDYCRTADPEMFMAKRGDSGQPFELAGMEGVRALFAVETEEGKHLAQAKVKRMTGQDDVVACRKFQHQYSFKPQWKIWLATNDKPRVNAMDDALWDRIKLIPFECKFRGTDQQVQNLSQVLLGEESSGILNWFIGGYKLWKKVGLMHPEEVSAAVEDWRENEDWFCRFSETRLEPTSNTQEYVSMKDAFDAFARWTEDNREVRGVNNTRFCELMRKAGHKSGPQKIGGKSVKVWQRVKLVHSLSSYSAPADVSDL